MPTEIESKNALVSSKINYVAYFLVLWPEIEPLVKDLLPDSVEGQVLRGVGILLFVLRTFFTSKPVRFGPPR